MLICIHKKKDYLLQVAFERVEEAVDRLVVGVPRLDMDRTEEVLEVDFSSKIFCYRVIFGGRVFESETPQEIWQPVQPGNGTALRDGNTLSVQLKVIILRIFNTHCPDMTLTIVTAPPSLPSP